MCIEATCKCGAVWYPDYDEQCEKGKNQVCPECGNREDGTISNTFDEEPYPSYKNFNERILK